MDTLREEISPISRSKPYKIDLSKQLINHHFTMLHLVLDIDHTLLEALPAETVPREYRPDKKLKINGVDIFVWFRPYLRYFLECLRTSEDLISSVSFFSMGTKPYCEAIINTLIPESKRSPRFPYKIFTRDDCEVISSGKTDFHIKNLKKMFWENNDMGASIKNTLIIDDNLYAHSLHPHNVIRIKPYYTEFVKHGFAHDTFLKDIYDSLVQYRLLNMKYTLPPCKCYYTQIRGKDNLDAENICFTCLTNHTIIRRQNKLMTHIYEKVLKLHRKIKSKENGL
jgi:TFIIF-interacting CTD phosphatase-like protein